MKKSPFKSLFISEDSQGVYSAIVYQTEKEAVDYGCRAHEYVRVGEERKAILRELRKWVKYKSNYIHTDRWMDKLKEMSNEKQD